MKKILMLVIIVILAVGVFYMVNTEKGVDMGLDMVEVMLEDEGIESNFEGETIESLRRREYTGSEIVIEEDLSPGSNYDRYIASYMSDGNKIYGLLTIPHRQEGERFPIVAFVHGYIPPREYRTTERYVAYQDRLARSGLITYKIDLRGHGNSEGTPVNTHYSYDYVIDTLNAIASLKKLPQADDQKIGVWGHSNGGEIGLRAMVIWPEIRAGVFWAGVVGSFEGMLETYNSKIPFLNMDTRINDFVLENGIPSQNPVFWNRIDPYTYLGDIRGAIQLHHGTGDDSVPVDTSLELREKLSQAGGRVEYFEYKGADHNLSGSAFDLAMDRSVEFFKTTFEF